MAMHTAMYHAFAAIKVKTLSPLAARILNRLEAYGKRKPVRKSRPVSTVREQ